MFQQLDEFTDPGCSELQPSTAGAVEDAIRLTVGKKESVAESTWQPVGRRFGSLGLNSAGWGNSSGGVWKSVWAEGPSVLQPTELPGWSAVTFGPMGTTL